VSAANEAFEQIVTSTEQNLTVIAPPGCGKTEVLAHRAEFLIADLLPGQRILALTFSNKAKANLEARLLKVLGAERKRRYVTVHNFHGHAAELLQSHGRTLGLSTDLSTLGKNTQRDATTPYLEGIGENAAHEMRSRIEDELRAAKQGPHDDAEVLARLTLAGADDRTVAIEKDRQRDGLLFYEDLLRHAQRLLRVPEIARLYRAHYGAVLVDEFQDLSPQLLDLALRTCDTSRSFVGDPLQGIYTWSGARPAHVERVLRRIGGEPHGLGVSHRSSPHVLNLVAAVAQPLGGVALQSHEPERWFEGGITAFTELASGPEEAAFIEQTCAQILARQPGATIGVICRSGWRRKPIDTHFATATTPCTRWDLAVDDVRIIELIEEHNKRLGGAPSLDALKNELLASIDPADVDTRADVLDALGQLAGLAQETGSIAAALTQVLVKDHTAEAIAPGVHLLNGHTGKGQQFDWVFIPGFEQGNVPSFLAKTRAALEEEQRVLLVMLSRARHGVVVTRATSLLSKKGWPYSPRTSRWEPEVRAAITADRANLAAHLDRLPSAI
jgi:DNA helicase-2/ATP-dependent DNA helicase PcrA